jgi:hypothetical protein
MKTRRMREGGLDWNERGNTGLVKQRGECEREDRTGDREGEE